ncbi:hypothetical protein KFE25_005897 [Diacronema lutheri]|uniref:Amino acid transporter n=2 Tax=Diacronema lutheri TaxID=2081491 RepID=A0A8J5XVW4_DIALT|nr:hypothetical protein KFE25_005897 [Diacronema lutheri]
MGALVGLAFRRSEPSHETLGVLGYAGELFVRSLKAPLAPMIFCSMITCTNASTHASSAVATLAPRYAVALYAASTALAAAIGVLAFELLRPGSGAAPPAGALGAEADGGAPLQPSGEHEARILHSLLALGRSIVPDNLPYALCEMKLLSVITAALAVGLAIRATRAAHPDAIAPVLALSKGVFEAALALISCLVLFAPLGVCSMVAACVAATPDLAAVASGLAMFVVTTVVAMLCHVFGSLSLLALLSAPRRNPWRYVRGLARVASMAFGTASSAATLSTTLECVVAQGVRRETAAFVLPLGATINMDGGAIGLVVSVLYLANASGQLGAMNALDVANVALVSALLSVGAAPVPSAGMVTLIMAMDGTGVRITSLTASVLALDWFTERLRTVVNVLSDAIVCLSVDALAVRAQQRAARDGAATLPKRELKSAEVRRW